MVEYNDDETKKSVCRYYRAAREPTSCFLPFFHPEAYSCILHDKSRVFLFLPFVLLPRRMHHSFFFFERIRTYFSTVLDLTLWLQAVRLTDTHVSPSFFSFLHSKHARNTHKQAWGCTVQSSGYKKDPAACPSTRTVACGVGGK